MALGVVWWLVVLKQWFAQAIHSESGQYSDRIDVSFRWAWPGSSSPKSCFSAHSSARCTGLACMPAPNLGDMENSLLWPGFKASGLLMCRGNRFASGHGGGLSDHGPLANPTINTALLLTSGWTLTIAHHALRDNLRGKCIAFMWMTVLLGMTFLGLQAFEYYEAYTT